MSTTYLGRIDKENKNKLTAEESFPISEHGCISGRPLDGTECQLLLDMGASKSFMSKSFYMCCKSLHSLPKFASKTPRRKVGNGQCVSVLFIIPVIIDVHGHRFEIYTLVSEIHENIDLVLGIKNVFKLEGVINSRDCCFTFLNRSVPIFPEKDVILKPNEQKLIKVRAPFVDEISGMIGVTDLRLLGYYKIKQGILQQNLSRYYRFKKAEKLCEYFNKFVNTLKKEREQRLPDDKYPWLDPDDEQRHMTKRF